MASSTLLSQLASAPATISGRIRVTMRSNPSQNRRSSSRRRPTWRARGRRRRGHSPCAGTSPPRGPQCARDTSDGVVEDVGSPSGSPEEVGAPSASGLEGDAPASRSASSSRTRRSRRTSKRASSPSVAVGSSLIGGRLTCVERRGEEGDRRAGRQRLGSAPDVRERAEKTGDGSRTRRERARTHRRRELELGRHRQAHARAQGLLHRPAERARANVTRRRRKRTAAFVVC